MNLALFIISSRLFLISLIFFLLFLYIRIRFFKLKIYFINRKSGKDSAGRNKLSDLNGIIHFHSVYSDGSGRIEDLIKIAKDLKADFLVSSDHNTLKPKFDGLEGYYDGLLYFAGEEINTEFGHLLALGIQNGIKRGKYKNVLSDIKKQNGISVICHPHNWWTPWKNFKVRGYDGIEIINLDSQWRGMNPFYIIAVILTYRINPFYALHFLSHKPKKTIKFWDSVQKHKSMKTGIASTDAHSNVKLTRKRRIKFPEYSDLFSVARTHILLSDKPSGNMEEDKKRIIEAIKKGRCHFSYDMFGIPEGFYYRISDGGKDYFSGDRVDLSLEDIDKKDKNVIIYAGININPEKTPFFINLFHNGEKIFSSKNKDLSYEIKSAGLKAAFNSGISRSSFYRIEIDVCFGRKKITYLYSNNIEIYCNGTVRNKKQDNI
ncbi:MAG: PHP domain-containing protein [bacterium]